MAIAYDTAKNLGTLVSSTSYTCTGSDLILIVGGYSLSYITAMTYNGVSMTKVTPSAGSTYVYWYLLNPATGTHNIVATGSVSYTSAVGASYTGVNQSSPFDSTGDNAGTSPVTASTTVVASNCWLVGIGYGSGTTGLNTLTSNRTDRAKSYSVGGPTEATISDSNGIVSTGSESIVYTDSHGVYLTTVVFSLAPAVATNGNMFLVM